MPQGRIVGGNETFEGEVPWMSAIYLHGGGETSVLCPGLVIISPCVRSERVLVRGSSGDGQTRHHGCSLHDGQK